MILIANLQGLLTSPWLLLVRQQLLDLKKKHMKFLFKSASLISTMSFVE